MKVFLSWSGPQSRAVAEALRTWLPRVIQALDPWMSPDIEKGARWITEITEQLEETRFGILCLTRSNLGAPWLLFEAGALSKTGDARVATFLLDLKHADVTFPLAQFQHTVAEKADVRGLLGSLNDALAKAGERMLAEDDLNDVFETYWPRLDTELQKAHAILADQESSVRSDRELLVEAVELLRSLDQRFGRRDSASVPTDSGDVERVLHHFIKTAVARRATETKGRSRESDEEVVGQEMPDPAYQTVVEPSSVATADESPTAST
jgi:hypothetical protein